MMMTMNASSAIPPAPVLAAFRATGTPRALPGGKGGTWRVGSVVLKQVENLAETLWRAEVLTEVPDTAQYRIARPIRASDGTWVVQNWEACQCVAGRSNRSRADDALRAGAAFHEAIADLTRPMFLDLRDDPWAVGDRVAWDEYPVTGCDAAMSLLRPLIEARRGVDLPPQVVHGDLLGNVLFAEGLPPAIIDWPPYWRPSSWAAAVVVIDALCWDGVSPELAARWSHLPAWGQMLIRALIYRIVTDETRFGARAWRPERVAAYQPVIDVAVSHAE